MRDKYSKVDFSNCSHSLHPAPSIIDDMSNRLSDETIRSRMTEWRNLKHLHVAQGRRIVHLEEENRTLKSRLADLEEKNVALVASLTDITFQLDEMKTLLFKKHRRARDIIDDDDMDDPPRVPRTPESYKRPVPTEAEVTETKQHPLLRVFVRTRTKVYYTEDIPLATGKIVVKHIVEQGYDPVLRQWVSASTLPTTPVTLGDNVRVLVSTLITIERLSFDQVRMMLRMLFKIHISDGEITNILDKEAARLAPAESALLSSIQVEASTHMDESRFDVSGETRYAWGIIGGTSGDCCYRLGVSRGKGIAEALRGNSVSRLISDDYAVYRYLAEFHQLCYAHLIRKFRDLAGHVGFSDAQRNDVVGTYRTIKNIYRSVVAACADENPLQHTEALTERFAAVATITDSDPRPVVRLKTTLMKNISHYLTCLRFPYLALTNNLAERALRHIVLKRKNSFGCKSDKGARTLSTLLSVLLSLYRRDPMGYMGKYLELRRV